MQLNPANQNNLNNPNVGGFSYPPINQPYPNSTPTTNPGINNTMVGNQHMSATFIMDKDVAQLINTIPEQYQDFIINFGIKLALEQNLVKQYITGYQIQINEAGVPEPVNTGNNNLNLATPQTGSNNRGIVNPPVSNSFGESAAGSKFNSW